MSPINTLRFILRVGFYGLSVIGLLISLSFFIVNISVLPQKISSVDEEPQGSPVSVTETNTIDTKPVYISPGLKPLERLITDYLPGDIAESAIQGLAYLELISLDLSAISPLLLVWFFSAILYNSYKYHVTWRKTDDQKFMLLNRIDSFPFPNRYQTVWIQLGFIGTLWGFLLIGWRLKSSLGIDSGQSIETLDILLKAFGTALLSTFTAVILAHVFAPVLRAVWLWMNAVHTEQPIDVDLKRSIHELSKELKESALAINLLSTEVEKFTLQLNQLELRPEKIAESMEEKVTEPIVAGIDKLADAINNSNAESTNKLADLMKSATKVSEKANERLDGIGETAQKLKDETKQNLQDVLDSNKKAAAKLESLNKTAEAIKTHTGRLPDTLKKAFVENNSAIVDQVLQNLNRSFQKLKKQINSRMDELKKIQSTSIALPHSRSRPPSLLSRVFRRSDSSGE